MKEEKIVTRPLDIPFKEFMPGQLIQSTQFNDDMRDIEDKVNEVITKHNSNVEDFHNHLGDKDNPHEVNPHQIGTFTGEEIAELYFDLRNGNFFDKVIKNRVLDDECVDNRVLQDGSVTATKADQEFGNQIDISENISIKDRYTKDETDELIYEKVGEGTYSKEEIDTKFEEYQAGTIVDNTIDASKLKDDVGSKIDISTNPSILDRYNKAEVDALIQKNGLPKDWGGLDDIPPDVDLSNYGQLPIAGVMTAGEFVTPLSDVLDIQIKENIDARGEFNSVGSRLDSFDSCVNEVSLQLDAIQNQEVSVNLFGAKGDGVTDNLKAFNDSVSFAIANNIKKIIIPSGTYILSNTFKLPSGFMLEGLGDVYLKQSTVDSPVLATKEYYDNTRPYGRTFIKNVNIIGATTNGINNHGILIWDYYTTIEKCDVTNCGGHGIFLTYKRLDGSTSSGNLVENVVKNCNIRYTNLTPFMLGEDSNNKITDGILENCMVSSNDGCDSDVFIGSSAGWFVNNIHTYGKSNKSLNIRNAYHTTVNNIYVENYKLNGLSCHVQTNLTLSNINIKVQDTVDSLSSSILINKSGIDYGTSICNISNLTLFNSVISKNVNGIENINSSVIVNVDNYSVGGKNIENITKYYGSGKSSIKVKDGVNISKNTTDGLYTLEYNSTKLKQYQHAKFNGNSSNELRIKIPIMNNYAKLIGKLNIFGNAYDNGTLLTSYSSEVFISAKNTSDELAIYSKELYAPTGFTVNPILTVSRTTSELIITFTATDTRNTGFLVFDYSVY